MPAVSIECASSEIDSASKRVRGWSGLGRIEVDRQLAQLGGLLRRLGEDRGEPAAHAALAARGAAGALGALRSRR